MYKKLNKKMVEEINWYDKEEVLRACVVGEMAQLLIIAMDWQKEYEKYKQIMLKQIEIKNETNNK